MNHFALPAGVRLHMLWGHGDKMKERKKERKKICIYLVLLLSGGKGRGG